MLLIPDLATPCTGSFVLQLLFREPVTNNLREGSDAVMIAAVFSSSE